MSARSSSATTTMDRQTSAESGVLETSMLISVSTLWITDSPTQSASPPLGPSGGKKVGIGIGAALGMVFLLLSVLLLWR